MVLKVRAGVPLVWRSPSSLQFGVGVPLVVLDELDAGPERLIAALVSGVSRSGFDMMARTVGMSQEAGDELLTRLQPVLEQPIATPTPESAPSRVIVTGDGPLAAELRRLLAAQGVLAGPEASTPDLAVLVAGWLIGAEDHGRWLRRDIPHLPVVATDAGVTIGPFVEPGAGPCLYCVQLELMDADPAWPAIATQLWSRPSPTPTTVAVSEAAAFAARRIAARLADGPPSPDAGALSWTLAAADGSISARGWSRHAECRCAAPPESDWAPAPDRAIRISTTRGTAVVEHA